MEKQLYPYSPGSKENGTSLEAAELIAFNKFNPTLTSRGTVSNQAKAISSETKFKDEMDLLFDNIPSGYAVFYGIEWAIEKIKELEYLNNEHRGVIGILMDEREVLRAEIEALKKENDFIKNNLCTPLLGPMFHGHTYEDGKALQTKPLTDEEIDDGEISEYLSSKEEWELELDCVFSTDSSYMEVERLLIEVGYQCGLRMHGMSKTGSSLVGLVRLGRPYIKAALKSRRS